jgi:hypothetical protein
MTRLTPTRSSKLALLPALIGALLLTACGHSLPPGQLSHPITMRPRRATPRHSVAVAVPRDLRPAIEHKGESPKFSSFVFFVFGAYGKKRGNAITDDRLISPNMPAELHQLSQAYLRRLGSFTRVTPATPRRSAGPRPPRADYLVTLDVRHLYGTQYRAVSVFVAASDQSASAMRSSTTLGVIGNAQLHVRLYDQRGDKPRLVSERVILGTATDAAGKRTISTIAKLATQDALERLSAYVDRAIARHAPPAESRRLQTLRLTRAKSSGQLRFVVQRVAANRKTTEYLIIGARSGEMLGRHVFPSLGVGFGAPGEWMLSRTRVDGSRMSHLEYRALADVLATTYDLRRIDDLRHFHFFGRRRAP